MLLHEPIIRLGAFIAVFTAIALWEAPWPRRIRSYARLRRWPSNLAIVALNTALVRILLPATAVSLALMSERRGWGLLNNSMSPTGARFHPIEIVLSMMIKFGVVVAIGAPALGVLLFEVLLNATSMFKITRRRAA